MTIRKQQPPQNYEAFSEDNPSESDRALGESLASYHQTDSDKSRSAAFEAQALASQSSWADTFAGGTPATTQTPVASTVDGDEVRNIQYQHMAAELDASDPPPLYTPTDTTASSPIVARSVVASEPVSTPVIVPVSRSPFDTQRPRADEENGYDAEEVVDNEECAFLPEPVQFHDHHHQRATVSEPNGLLVLLQPPDQSTSKRWCGGHRQKRGCGGRWRGRGIRDKEKSRRFKRACCFVLTFLLCLWILIPGLLRALFHDRSPQFPHPGARPSPSSGAKPSPSPWPPEKREQRQHETSRSIKGTYKLYDLLDLSTTSGSITVTVEVQSGEKPAVLRIASSSGSVRVNMRFESPLFPPQIPKGADDRVLDTDISTHSGSISGSLVHGKGGSTRISTHSSSITLDIFTHGVSEHDPVSNISTSSKSGSQNIRVVAPKRSTEPVRAIEASHTVLGSGSMRINYPSEWEGTVHMKQQGSGNVWASGEGLLVRKESSGELYGYKGNKEGRTIEIFEQGSGTIKFHC